MTLIIFTELKRDGVREEAQLKNSEEIETLVGKVEM